MGCGGLSRSVVIAGKEKGEAETAKVSTYEVKNNQSVMCLDIYTSMTSGKIKKKWREAKFITREFESISDKNSKVKIRFIGWKESEDIVLDLNIKDDRARLCPPRGILSHEQISEGIPLDEEQLLLSNNYLIAGYDWGEDTHEKKLKPAASSPTGSLRKGKSWQQGTLVKHKRSSSEKYKYDTYHSDFIKSKKGGSVNESEIIRNEEISDDRIKMKKGVVGLRFNNNENNQAERGETNIKRKKINRRRSFPALGRVHLSPNKDFEERMAVEGLHIFEVESDGNCLFRAISHQMFLDPEKHVELRQQCIDHMVAFKDRFAPFCSENFDQYIEKKKMNGIWGDDLEIKAMEEIMDRRIIIYSEDSGFIAPLNTHFDSDYNSNVVASSSPSTSKASRKSGSLEFVEPIILSYHGQSHYNSVFYVKYSLPLPMRTSRDILRKRMQLEKSRCHD